MSKLRKKYLQEMQRRNYSPRTIKTYESCLVSLSAYYNQSPDKISIEQIKKYLYYRITETKSSAVLVNQTISAVKILHQGVLGLAWEPVKLIRPRREKRLPIVLSRQEIKQILLVTENIKHKAILTLAYSSGLRMSELLNLRIEDVHSNRMQIKVCLGKGNKDRCTILSEITLELLRYYYKLYRPKYWLFEGTMNKKYSSSSVRKIFKKACKKAEINKHICFHSLRHSFATHLLEQGVSIQIIQRLLGHSTPKTTCIYLHIQQYSLDKIKSPIDYEGGLV
jgi:site-specific recombinase XerD